jgi:hypothetical protein
MMKQSTLVFKELKNVKRSSTVLSPSTSKDLINSAKDIRNRSTKQIDTANFIEVVLCLSLEQKLEDKEH